MTQGFAAPVNIYYFDLICNNISFFGGRIKEMIRQNQPYQGTSQDKGQGLAMLHHLMAL